MGKKPRQIIKGIMQHDKYYNKKCTTQVCGEEDPINFMWKGQGRQASKKN